MKNLIYFGIFAIALTVSANADAAVATQETIRSITFETLSECNSSAAAASAGSCVAETDGSGYYFTQANLTTLDRDFAATDFEVAEFEAIGSGDGDTGTTTTATVNTCSSDMKLSSDGCCCVMK